MPRVREAVMKLRTYIWRWLGAAFSHALGVIDLWAGLGGAVVAGIAHFLPQEQAAELNSLAWQVPLWALGVVMLVRIVLAPYWLYRDLDSDYSDLKGSDHHSRSIGRRVNKARGYLGGRDNVKKCTFGKKPAIAG